MSKHINLDARFRAYKRTGVSWMRPYEVGESLKGVSVSDNDTPGEGGFVAIDPYDTKDQWYVNAEFAKKYELK